MTPADTKSTPVLSPQANENAVMMPPYLRVRMAVQIFLAFAVMGAWLPVFTLYLTRLGFAPEQVAWASATNAIGALIAPLIWGQIADRWLAMERCISLCALSSGIALWVLSTLTEPFAVFFVCVMLWFFLVPLIGLTSSFIFRQLEHPERDFGKIRLWGTLGWMGANWLLTWWFEQLQGLFQAIASPPTDLGDSLRLGSLAAFVVAGYALTLPHTPPRPSTAESLDQTGWLRRLADAPMCALRLFRDRSFVVYCLCMFGFYVTFPFPIQLNPLLMQSLDVDAKRLPTVLTIAQGTEAVSLFLLPLLLTRLGAKATMLLGCAMWTAGLGILSVGHPHWFVLTALAAHGLFISCFVISGQVYVNKQATHDIRASAQAFLILINGFGLLLGHLLVGWIRAATQSEFRIAYQIAALVAGSMVMVFLIGFSASAPIEAPPQESLVADDEMA